MTAGRPSPVLLGCAALALLFACPRGDAPAPDEAFLRKLQAAPATPRPVDNDALAQAAQGTTKPTTLAVLDGGAAVGSVSARATALTLTQQVQGRRMALSTADTFLRVALELTGPGTVDTSRAALRRGQASFGIARDVMRLVGTPVTAAALDGGTAELLLYFELPAADVGPGLELVLPTEAGELQLRLQ